MCSLFIRVAQNIDNPTRKKIQLLNSLIPLMLFCQNTRLIHSIWETTYILCEHINCICVSGYDVYVDINTVHMTHDLHKLSSIAFAYKLTYEYYDTNYNRNLP